MTATRVDALEMGANHFRLQPEEVAEGHGAFLVAVRRGRSVGCGAAA